MKFLRDLFIKPTVRHLGRWNIHDNTFKKVDSANIDNCGDKLCGIFKPKDKKPKDK